MFGGGRCVAAGAGVIWCCAQANRINRANKRDDIATRVERLWPQPSDADTFPRRPDDWSSSAYVPKIYPVQVEVKIAAIV